MSIYFQGKRISGMGALTEPSTYDADITPENMQNGMTAYAQGKKVIGTGKAFEFAEYGSKAVRTVTDNEGIERYGVKFAVGEGTNVVFLAPSATGEVVLQTNYLVSLSEGTTTQLGVNQTSGGEVYACYSEGYLTVYMTEITQKKTMLRLFVGKDNAI